MVTIDKAVIARLKKGKENFEVLVDCENALKLRKGESIGLGDVLATHEIFKDSSKGTRASKSALEIAFDTDDAEKIAVEIIKKGEIQLTAEHRKEQKELKRRQIITSIHRNCVDPRTHLPHPVTRIENAFEEGKIKIDENQAVERQMQDIIRKLQPILPMKFEKKEIAIKMAPQYAAKCHQPIRQYGTVLQEEWLSSGNLAVVVEIPAGVQEEFFDKLNSLTKGDIEIKVLSTK